MSIASEISRLQTAKADLKTAIEGKGVTVSSSAKLDDYADLVGAISQGGGSGVGDLTKYETKTITPASATSMTCTHSLGVIPKIVIIEINDYSSGDVMTKFILMPGLGAGCFGASTRLGYNVVTDGSAIGNSGASLSSTDVSVYRAAASRQLSTNHSYTFKIYA